MRVSGEHTAERGPCQSSWEPPELSAPGRRAQSESAQQRGACGPWEAFGQDPECKAHTMGARHKAGCIIYGKAEKRPSFEFHVSF